MILLSFHSCIATYLKGLGQDTLTSCHKRSRTFSDFPWTIHQQLDPQWPIRSSTYILHMQHTHMGCGEVSVRFGMGCLADRPGMWCQWNSIYGGGHWKQIRALVLLMNILEAIKRHMGTLRTWRRAGSAWEVGGSNQLGPGFLLQDVTGYQLGK